MLTTQHYNPLFIPVTFTVSHYQLLHFSLLIANLFLDYFQLIPFLFPGPSLLPAYSQLITSLFPRSFCFVSIRIFNMFMLLQYFYFSLHFQYIFECYLPYTLCNVHLRLANETDYKICIIFFLVKLLFITVVTDENIRGK